jgi:hypothetical protein
MSLVVVQHVWGYTFMNIWIQTIKFVIYGKDILLDIKYTKGFLHFEFKWFLHHLTFKEDVKGHSLP